jgi:hypothetical protein
MAITQKSLPIHNHEEERNDKGWIQIDSDVTFSESSAPSHQLPSPVTLDDIRALILVLRHDLDSTVNSNTSNSPFQTSFKVSNELQSLPPPKKKKTSTTEVTQIIFFLKMWTQIILGSVAELQKSKFPHVAAVMSSALQRCPFPWLPCFKKVFRVTGPASADLIPQLAELAQKVRN